MAVYSDNNRHVVVRITDLVQPGSSHGIGQIR